MIVAPVLTDQPTAPEYWECRDVQAPDDIMGTARFGDPAGLSDLQIMGLVDNAVDEVARWHAIADTGRVPTPAWKALLSPETFSGYKLHVQCANFADVRWVLALAFETCWRAGLGCKAATAIDAGRLDKGVVVYLPRRATVDRDASLIARALAPYTPSGPVGTPIGSEPLTGPVWWRHEFGGVDPGYDVPRFEYRGLYVSAALGVSG